jgi:hypothetical protein
MKSGLRQRRQMRFAQKPSGCQKAKRTEGATKQNTTIGIGWRVHTTRVEVRRGASHNGRMIELNWDDFYNVVPSLDVDDSLQGYLDFGKQRIYQNETVNFGAPIGSVNVKDLMKHCYSYMQLAMMVFVATRRVYALNTYFPITKILDKNEQKDFYQLAAKIMRQPSFKVSHIRWITKRPGGIMDAENAWGKKKEKPTLMVDDHSPRVAETAFFIACHIAEIFFYQRPILDQLLKAAFEIRIATSPEAFEKDGGVAGGNFRADRGCIQILIPRFFEGFNGKTPGVAPFLHEFGHLLDHFDVKERRLTESYGTLPGMRPGEGQTYNPQAQNLFLKGKQLEWQRYMHLLQKEDGYQEGDPMPIGHPYVFQNNGEFIAGYFEMFFRNPHYFAEQNHDLFESFVLTFGYDPRKVWDKDFPFYIEQNQTFYREHKPPQPGLTL